MRCLKAYHNENGIFYEVKNSTSDVRMRYWDEKYLQSTFKLRHETQWRSYTNQYKLVIFFTVSLSAVTVAALEKEYLVMKYI